VFLHAIEEGLVDPRRMVQIGIRSPMPREVYDWTVGKGVTIVSAEEAHSSTPDNVARLVCETVGAGPVYLTFDIDANLLFPQGQVADRKRAVDAGFNHDFFLKAVAEREAIEFPQKSLLGDSKHSFQAAAR
jgi:hypothetical protein